MKKLQYLPFEIFCKLDKLDIINLENNTLTNIYGKGFGRECGNNSPSSLTDLDIAKNEIRILLKERYLYPFNAFEETQSSPQ